MNIVIVSVLLSIAVVTLVSMGFVFGGYYGACCWPSSSRRRSSRGCMWLKRSRWKPRYELERGQ